MLIAKLLTPILVLLVPIYSGLLINGEIVCVCVGGGGGEQIAILISYINIIGENIYYTLLVWINCHFHFQSFVFIILIF